MTTAGRLLREIVGEGVESRQDENEKEAVVDQSVSFPFATVTILWIIHMIYYMQWFRRRELRRRRHNHQKLKHPQRPKASYSRLVEQKKFHLLWSTTLSVLPPPQRNSSGANAGTAATMPVAAQSQLVVPMGNAGLSDEEALLRREWASSPMDRLLQTVSNLIRTHIGSNQRCRSIVDRCNQFLQHCGGLAVVLRVVYHTHLLWSCRALEGAAPSSWSYVCSLTTIVVGGMAVELFLEHSFLAKYTTSTSNSSSNGIEDADDSDDSFVRRFLRKEIRHRRLVSLSLPSLTATVLMLFRQQFPFITIPVLPFLPSLAGGPVLSHFLCLLLLGLVSTRQHRRVYVEIWWGCGVAWLGGSMVMNSSPLLCYWTSPLVVLGLVVLPLLSLRVQYAPWWLRWIDNVGWNRRGRLLVYAELSSSSSSADACTEQDQWVGVPNGDDDDDSDDGANDEMGDEMTEEHEENRGDFTNAADDDQSDSPSSTELTPLVGNGSSNMRSRRNNAS